MAAPAMQRESESTVPRLSLSLRIRMEVNRLHVRHELVLEVHSTVRLSFEMINNVAITTWQRDACTVQWQVVSGSVVQATREWQALKSTLLSGLHYQYLGSTAASHL